jgi:hypothetical protein
VVRRSEADLDAFEVSIRAVLDNATGWTRGGSEATRPIERLHQRTKAIAEDLRLDMRALLNTQRARTEPFQIALFGRTKSGKSTLYGALSREPGAERHIGKGGDRTTQDIRTYPAAGILFVDVPGICAYGQEGRFDEQVARTIVEPSDVILFMVTDDGVHEPELEALYQLRLFNKPLILVHNLKLGLDDKFTLDRARKGRERVFEERTLDEHSRRIDRYFRERGINGPDRVIPIHADAAWRSIREQDPAMARWFRDFSRIADLEAALVEYAAYRGTFIRARTYSEPLIRFHDDTIARLRRDVIALGTHRRFVSDQKSRLVRLMFRIERDSLAKLDAIPSTFAPLEAQIDQLLEEYAGEELLARWTSLLNGPGTQIAIESLATTLAADINTGLAAFQQQSEYDAATIARDIEVECDAAMPTLGTAGRWWRRAGMSVAAIAGVAAVLTPGGIVVGVLGAIGGYVLNRVGDSVEKKRRRDFESSREAARTMMLESLRKKEAGVRRTLERWLRKQLGEPAQRRAGQDFDDLLRGVETVRGATEGCADALSLTLDDENRRLLWIAFRTANNADPPIIHRVARSQGALVKAFCATEPPLELQEATAALLGERVYMLRGQEQLGRAVAIALAPAQIDPAQVRIRHARDTGQWPTASVGVPDSERGRAIGPRGLNVTVAQRLCRTWISIDRISRRGT